MIRHLLRLLAGLSIALLALEGNADEPMAARTLDIYFIELGQAGPYNCTLLVAPDGTTMMLDSGLPTSVPRIMEVMKRAGVAQIDYLVTTHYHGDHCGGAAALAKQVPIVHFVDHGAS